MKNAFLFLIIIILAIACETDENSGTETSLELISGSSQSTEPGMTLSDSIVIMIRDHELNPFEGATVYFEVTQGDVSSSEAITDKYGRVSVQWTLGTTTEEQILRIRSFKSNGVTDIQGSPLHVSARTFPNCASENFADDLECPPGTDAVVTFCLGETDNSYLILQGIKYYCTGIETSTCDDALYQVAQILIADGCGKKKSVNTEYFMCKLEDLRTQVLSNNF